MTKFNYFKNIETKYKSNISSNKTLIIRLDGRNVCGNKNLNLLDETDGSLSDSMKKVAQYMSEEYNCIVYVGSDEINIIIRNPKIIINKYESQETHKIASLISQEVFLKFNSFYKGPTEIFFDARCFSIPNNKFLSYLKYRYKATINVLTVYFAKNKVPTIKRNVGMSLKNLDKKLRKYEEYNNRSIYQKEGLSYYSGIKYETMNLINMFEKYENNNSDIKDNNEDINYNNVLNNIENNNIEIIKKAEDYIYDDNFYDDDI